MSPERSSSRRPDPRQHDGHVVDAAGAVGACATRPRAASVEASRRRPAPRRWRPRGRTTRGRRCTAARRRRRARSVETRSAWTSASAPSARVITLRWGWLSASSAVMLPRRTSSATTEWSSVTWRSVAVAPEVGARVAHVHHVEAAVAQHRRGHRRAHPALVRVVAGHAPDRAVGALDRALRTVVGAAPGPSAADRVDGHLGRDLAGLGAAHAVGHGQQSGARDGAVLVVVADPPGVGELGHLDQGERAVRRCPRRSSTPRSGGSSGRSAARRGP